MEKLTVGQLKDQTEELDGAFTFLVAPNNKPYGINFHSVNSLDTVLALSFGSQIVELDYYKWGKKGSPVYLKDFREKVTSENENLTMEIDYEDNIIFVAIVRFEVREKFIILYYNA